MFDDDDQTATIDNTKSLLHNLRGPWGASIYDPQMKKQTEKLAAKSWSARVNAATKVARAVLDYDWGSSGRYDLVAHPGRDKLSRHRHLRPINMSRMKNLPNGAAPHLRRGFRDSEMTFFQFSPSDTALRVKHD